MPSADKNGGVEGSPVVFFWSLSTLQTLKTCDVSVRHCHVLYVLVLLSDNVEQHALIVFILFKIVSQQFVKSLLQI